MNACEKCGRKVRSVILRTNGKLLCADCNQERWIAMDPRKFIVRRLDRLTAIRSG